MRRPQPRGARVDLKKVLLVDDEPDILRLAQLALTTLDGLTTCLARSGPEALELAVAEHPDLVLLDVMMPGMDGLATLARLRDHPATAAIPVVLLTARVQEHEVAGYLERGAAGVIRKPFDPTTLGGQILRIAGGL
jgi:two-component system OmpR family response regulator